MKYLVLPIGYDYPEGVKAPAMDDLKALREFAHSMVGEEAPEFHADVDKMKLEDLHEYFTGNGCTFEEQTNGN